MKKNEDFIKICLKCLVILMGLTFFSSYSLADDAVLSLSSEPLYANSRNAKPTLTLALSVEYPTVGAQYLTSYQENTEYIGYFNQNLCYNYVNNGAINVENHFIPANAASAHKCGGTSFSGNFLNWATSSAIDVLRYSLTGGDRIIDEPNRTVLQRAVILSSFYRSANFPRKNISNAVARNAVPTSLLRRPNGMAHTGDVFISNCLDRVYFTTDGSGSCNDTMNNNQLGRPSLTSRAYFYARVEVCGSSGGTLLDRRTVQGSDYFLCELYPSGNYKPTGKLQRFNDALRVAAFGYPLHNGDKGIYKGVLRAPMKFVGPNTYNSNYEPIGANPKREWDPDTGVFVNDPEGAGSSYNSSGVINYLNRFGRTGIPGSYVGMDHVNQLYYEALRYIQGLQPTPAAVSSSVVNSSTLDGFPIYTSWQDPHPAITGMGSTGDYSCYRNHIVVIGDKNTHTDDMVPGYNRTPAGDDQNEPNFWNWTNVAGGFEGNSNASYVDGSGAVRLTSGNPNPYTQKANMASQATGSGNRSNYSLVGMAYWANTHDIRGAQWTAWSAASGSGDPRRPGMRATSYFIDVNESNGSATVAQRQSVNQYFYAAKYGGFDATRSLGGNPFTSDGIVFTNALWQREPQADLFPKSYFLASEPKAVLDAFDTIFAVIISNNFSIAGVAANGDIVYQAKFNGASWSGDIVANKVTISGGGDVSLAEEHGWSVAQALAAKAWGLRNISMGAYRNSPGDYSALTFLADNLTASQRVALATGKTTDINAILNSRVNYLRGDRSLEGSSMRLRDSVLGDIINSAVVYKGPPESKQYGSSYTSFYNSHKTRRGMLFVGANDGMLHVFDAVDGEELLAYIPSFVFDKLYELTMPDYNHRSYVDATPSVAEAEVNGAWKTVVVGGAGAGGQGVYALDVTKPASFVPANQLWEFTDQDDSTLGNVMGRPEIARIPVKNALGVIEYKWYAIIPGGVNNQIADGNQASTGTGPAIFLLDLSKGAGAWSRNSNYYRFTLPTVSGRPQGLINISITLDKNNALKAIYAGDLAGQVWKLSLGEDRTTWASTSPTKLFQTPAGQSITMPVQVSSNGSKTFLSFGTGKYLEVADSNVPFTTQALYTILDADENVPMSALVQSRPTVNKEFQATAFTWGKPSEIVEDSPIRSGWYLNLPSSGSTGERMIYDVTVKDGTLLANSIIPSVGGCDVGSSRRYMVKMLSAAGSYSDVEDQFLGGASVVEGPPTTWVDPDTGNTVSGSGGTSISGGTNGIDQGSKIPGVVGSVIGLLDWREIHDYDVLKNSF